MVKDCQASINYCEEKKKKQNRHRGEGRGERDTHKT
jgi:hypothetical protein